MRTASFVSALTLAVGLAAPTAGRAQTLDSLVNARIGAVASGMVAGAWDQGEVVYLEAWGSTTHDGAEAMPVDAIFPFPGLTEVLLAATVRALDAADALDAHAPIGPYFPDLAPSLRGATLDQLLRHTAGLVDAPAAAPDSLFERIDVLGSGAVLAPPGVVFSRSRYSYPLAARVLERAVGLPVEEVISQALLRPLGMERSTFDPAEAATRGTVPGHHPAPDTASPPAPTSSAHRVDGLPVLHTSVPELLQFVGAWMGGSVTGGGPGALPPDPEHPRLDEALVDGFLRGDYQLYTELERTDLAGGHTVVLRAYPELGTAVAAWANGGPGLEGPARTADPGALDLPLDVASYMTERLVGPDFPVTVTEELPDSTRPASGPAAVPLWAWAGRYLNSDRIIVLRPPETEGMEAELAFFNGERELPLERLADGSVLARVPEDGRPAARFLLVRDAEGRRYVFFGGKAFRQIGGR